jgi:hypothetical protein
MVPHPAGARQWTASAATDPSPRTSSSPARRRGQSSRTGSGDEALVRDLHDEQRDRCCAIRDHEVDRVRPAVLAGTIIVAPVPSLSTRRPDSSSTSTGRLHVHPAHKQRAVDPVPDFGFAGERRPVSPTGSC